MHSMKLGIEELLRLCFKTYEWETVPEHRKHFRYVGRKKKSTSIIQPVISMNSLYTQCI